jgi:hypothetical protein
MLPQALSGGFVAVLVGAHGNIRVPFRTTKSLHVVQLVFTRPSAA